METRPIAQIKVGARFRRELGDISALADSIGRIGLLHPIVITPDGTLVAGMRRLRAVHSLGWREIPVRVVDLEDLMQAEHDENVVRKDFLPSEAVAIARAMEPAERKAARERQRKAGIANLPTVSGGKFPPLTDMRKGKTRDRVAIYVGMSERTLRKATKVVAAAEREPERFGHLVEEMDQTGKVDHAYRKLLREKWRQAYEERRRDPGPMSGKYRVIYADPPWQYENASLTERHYKTMPLEDICALPVRKIAEDDAVLFLWTTSPMLENAFSVIHAWGFHYRASFIWDKVRHNYGRYNSVRHELLLVATRGKCAPDNRILYDSVQPIERTTKHSEKPARFREIIDVLYPYGRRIELFARVSVDGWDSWGDEWHDQAGQAG